MWSWHTAGFSRAFDSYLGHILWSIWKEHVCFEVYSVYVWKCMVCMFEKIFVHFDD